jgi:peroxiredoxin
MSIKVGDKFPSVTVKKLGADGLDDVDTGTLVAEGKTVLFGLPGAYTGTCHKVHLPGYLARADELKGKGVARIVCLAVNDPFVMAAWGEVSGVGDKIFMLPDGNGELTAALGLGFDGSGAGLGTRAKRFSMVLEDGVVKSLEVEEKPGEVTVSGADACAV